MKHLGLIGYPLSHSFSVKYFSEKFSREGISEFEYLNYPIQSVQELKPMIEEKEDLIGLNVTIPHKEAVMPLLDEIDPEAAEIGAVNTIRIMRSSGKIHLKGYNSDAYGFRESLLPLLGASHQNALVLGTGGASKAITHVLEQLGISYQYVSRTPAKDQLHYLDLCYSVIKKHTLIINTTPLGTYPNTSAFPNIPYDLVTSGHILYDLVYNPPETEFLRFGKQKGATVMNGHEML
ncbi:MAG: shikimate dehydrogenase, partial [Bacteroidales bacterium]|nr:shikimate dehydrogenase [Bacteroidales bacterium]